MTRRERAEARLARRLEWAQKRDAKAAAGFRRADQIASGIPMGQPILVGHHSEKHHRRDIARIDSGMRAGVESTKMAEHHRAKADGIAFQLERTIFSDDEDAIEKLQEKIAGLEAERARRKAANKIFKKGGVEALIAADPKAAEDYAFIQRYTPYHKMPYPSYSLTNLGANIRRCKQRVEEITRQKGGEACPPSTS